MSRLLRLDRNEKGRDFLITDNHGCWDEVEDALAAVGFDEDTDRLLHAGDMVDRGPDSWAAVSWLAKPFFHAILGNHEMLAIGIANGQFDQERYLANGGEWFLQLPSHQQQMIAQLFSALPLAMEIDTPHGLVGVVHAEPLDDWSAMREVLDRFDSLSNTQAHLLTEQLLWSRRVIYREIPFTECRGIDKVYVGHTPRLVIETIGNVHYVDGGLPYGHCLNMINLTEASIIKIPARRRYWDKRQQQPTPA